MVGLPALALADLWSRRRCTGSAPKETEDLQKQGQAEAKKSKEREREEEHRKYEL